MTTSSDHFFDAWRHTEQAREINERFEGKQMPADAVRQVQRHLSDAAECRRKGEDVQRWESEPQYKHAMIGGDTHPYDSPSGREDVARKGFLSYVRSGVMSSEQKAALVEDSTGLNLVPTDFAGTILKTLPRLSVIRNLAYVRPTTKAIVDVGSVTIGTAGWGKLETNQGTIDSTGAGLGGTPAAKQTIKVWDTNALVLLGRDELEDSDDNLEDIIRQALTLKIAELEDDAFAGGAGDASFQPYAVTNGVTQNISAAADNTPTPDDLKKLTFKVPAQFRRMGATTAVGRSRATYLWHSNVEQAVALMKDNNGNYLMQPSANDADPGTLFGYRWFSVDGLADPATAGISQKSVVFGDVFSAYMIADRRSLTVQRLTEAYATSGKVGLLFTHRVGGDVIRPSALATYTL